MSQQITQIPETLIKYPNCARRPWVIEVLKILNPDTLDLNAKADLKCRDCGHSWVGLVTAPKWRAAFIPPIKEASPKGRRR